MLASVLFMTSCRSSRQTTTEQIEKEVTHDAVVELGSLVVHDTVRETQTVTIVLNADSTERSRTTEKNREHLRSSAATDEKARILESTVQSEARKEEIQSVAARPSGSPVKPFLWGALAGAIITTIIYLKTRKR